MINQQAVHSIVEEVMKQFEQRQNRFKPVPIAVSARHAHLSKEHLEVLFGYGFKLSKRSDLSQPGQFAANETITIAGVKGSIERVRILGPARGSTQIEISRTDALKLGVTPPLRQSGDISGSSPCTLIGPKGSIYIHEGLIIAGRHIHMTPEDAEHYKVKDQEYVDVKVESERPVTFEQVLVRVSSRYRLEMHIDTDEANAAFISKGQTGTLFKRESRGGQ